MSLFNRRRRIIVLLLAVLLPSLLPALPAGAATRAELDERVERSGEVFRELREAPDRRIPDDLIARAKCVAVIPNVIKAAWILGGRWGRGVLSCRSKAGEWSPPVHVLMSGGSFGLQAGASSTDVVLFFMTTESVRSLLASKVKLSGEMGLAAGPVGRETEAATDAGFRAQIYSYARSRGLFAGVSVAGGYLGVERDDTAAYYGKMLPTTQILFEHRVDAMPKSAWSFLHALPRSQRTVAQGEPAPPARPAAKAAAPAAAEPPPAAPQISVQPPPAVAPAPAPPAPRQLAPTVVGGPAPPVSRPRPADSDAVLGAGDPPQEELMGPPAP